MNLNCGIIGLPNVGKSSFFNALTNSDIPSENYPFCTIEANSAIVEVRDKRLKEISSIVKPSRIIYSTVEFVDIAGLVAGASKGEGLGNQFLANISEIIDLAERSFLLEEKPRNYTQSSNRMARYNIPIDCLDR